MPRYVLKNNGKEDFKNKILKCLYDNRIYKNKDLDMFCKLLLDKNRDYISEYEIRKLFEEVKKKLEE